MLVNFDYNINPNDTARLILFDKDNNFDKTYLRRKGISNDGLLYCLERLKKEKEFDITYNIVKIDFTNPNINKNKIINYFKEGYMAIINVGPSEISPLTFSKHGHYLVISYVDKSNKFYVINSNEIGDNQTDISYDYDTIIKNMYGRKESFNFLFINRTWETNEANYK